MEKIDESTDAIAKQIVDAAFAVHSTLGVSKQNPKRERGVMIPMLRNVEPVASAPGSVRG